MNQQAHCFAQLITNNQTRLSLKDSPVEPLLRISVTHQLTDKNTKEENKTEKINAIENVSSKIKHRPTEALLKGALRDESMIEKTVNNRITAAIILDTTSKDMDEIERFVNEKIGTNLIFVKRAPQWVKLKVKQDCS